MISFQKNFRANMKNEIYQYSFFLESRAIFLGSPDTITPLENIQEEFKKLDTNKNGKLEDSESSLRSKASTAEKVAHIHSTAVTHLTSFFEKADPRHSVSANERAKQVLETSVYTLESREAQHVDMIFQDYLKVFEKYSGATTEKTRKFGVMKEGRIRTLPRTILGIKNMNLELENPSYLIENNLVHSNPAKGGFGNLEKNFPNAKVLVIEINGKKQVELFKTGIVKVEAIERFGVKTGIRVLDGDGDIHIYDSVKGSQTVDSDALERASQNKGKTSAIQKEGLIQKKYEKITPSEFSFLEKAKKQVSKVIKNHLDNNSHQDSDKKIDWNDAFENVFFEKNGEIWIDTKNGMRTDFDWKNESFLKTPTLNEKNPSEISDFLNEHRELLFGDAITELQENKERIQQERANEKKAAQKTESYAKPPNNLQNFLQSNLANKKISEVDFSDNNSKEYKQFSAYLQKISPNASFKKVRQNIQIKTQDKKLDITFDKSMTLSEVIERMENTINSKEVLNEGVSIISKVFKDESSTSKFLNNGKEEITRTIDKNHNLSFSIEGKKLDITEKKSSKKNSKNNDIIIPEISTTQDILNGNIDSHFSGNTKNIKTLEGIFSTIFKKKNSTVS